MRNEREVVLSSVMTRTLHEAGLRKLAINWAYKILELVNGLTKFIKKNSNLFRTKI